MNIGEHNTQSAAFALGIDGCNGAWVVASLDPLGLNSVIKFEVHPTLDFLTSLAPSRVCIDIPIGLSRSGRTCDALARRALPGAASRVFTAPCREVLACTSWSDANATSKQLTGKGLSQQAFNITHKIREADELLARAPHLRGVLREVHPEVCFAHLARHVLPSKKKAEGVAARVAILVNRLAISEPQLRAHAARLRPAGAKLDDLLDAAVALVVALAPSAAIRVLPAQPEHDERGLAMEMIYGDL